MPLDYFDSEIHWLIHQLNGQQRSEIMSWPNSVRQDMIDREIKKLEEEAKRAREVASKMRR